MTIVIPLLFALSLGGLTSVLLRALYAGADVYSGTYSQETARGFEDLFLFIPPRRIAEAGWASGGAAFIVVFLLTTDLTTLPGVLIGLAAGTAAGALALRAPGAALRLLRRRRTARFNTQLAEALLGMSNALKAGFSIAQSFETVVQEGLSPIAQEFDVVLQETRIGVSFSDALANMERRVGSDDLSLVVSAIEAARRSGGNLTEIFDTIAGTIRERLRIEDRIRTLTAQGRLQGIVVGSMPVLILAVLLVIDPGLMLPFVRSTVGAVTLGIVAVMVALGAYFIRKIVNIDI